MPESWDRQPNETTKAYAAFCFYLEQPPHTRSVEEAWRRYNSAKSGGKLRGAAQFFWAWVNKNEWKTRAHQHDTAIRASARANVHNEMEDALRSQLQNLTPASDSIFEMLRITPLHKMSSHALLLLLPQLIRLQREAYDQLAELSQMGVAAGGAEPTSAETLEDLLRRRHNDPDDAA